MTLKLQVMLIEDEPLARDRLRQVIGYYPQLEIVGEACDGREALRMLEDYDPQIIFLDVQLPEFSGIEVLRRAKRQPEAVVFTSAFDDYAIAAFEFGAFDYLLKPFQENRLRGAIERVLLRLPVEGPIVPLEQRLYTDSGARLSRFFVRSGRATFPVDVSDVIAFQAEDDYTAVVTSERRHLIHVALQEFQERLDPNHFVRIHRSTIVNLNHIVQLVHEERRILVQMRNGSAFHTSRNGMQLLRQVLH
jgi:two-component system, LytTR family, response regulator